jgi:hypothetical protein
MKLLNLNIQLFAHVKLKVLLKMVVIQLVVDLVLNLVMAKLLKQEVLFIAKEEQRFIQELMWEWGKDHTLFAKIDG